MSCHCVLHPGSVYQRVTTFVVCVCVCVCVCMCVLYIYSFGNLLSFMLANIPPLFALHSQVKQQQYACAVHHLPHPSTHISPPHSRFHDHWRFVFQRLSFLASLLHYMRTGQLASRGDVAMMLGGGLCVYSHLNVNGACLV